MQMGSSSNRKLLAEVILMLADLCTHSAMGYGYYREALEVWMETLKTIKVKTMLGRLFGIPKIIKLYGGKQ